MSELISKINIKSYRGINSLELNNLQQINILTGDNNSGKTSVLEVINIFKQPDVFRTWDEVTREDSYMRGISLYESYNDFFNINQSKKQVKFEIMTANGKRKIELLAQDSESPMKKKNYYARMGFLVVDEEEQEGEEIIIVPITSMEVRIDGEKTDTLSLCEGQRRPRGVAITKRRIMYFHNVVYVLPFEHTRSQLYLKDILNYPNLYQEVIDVLKEFDPNIISINYDDGGDSRRSGHYRILSSENNRSLPLDMYGDGMKKAVLLMSAVIKAQNGILLLDEFETAIHTSAMDRVFRWILETCCKLNVQVFLTSHSEEAIKKVLNCSNELQEKMALYTLYKDEEGNSVRRLSAKKAIDLYENMGWELR